MIQKSLSESDGQLWQPSEFENMANLDFENLNHLQNLGNVLLTARII